MAAQSPQQYLARLDSLIILPEQLQNPKELTPSQRLCLAILEDAILIIQQSKNISNNKRHASYTRLVEGTKNWFKANDENDSWPFTFLNICTYLHLSPSYIRGLLFASKTKKLQAREYKKRVR